MTLRVEIEKAITCGTVRAMVQSAEQNDIVREVNFDPPVTSLGDPHGKIYTIEVKDTLPKKNIRSEVVCFFPNHRNYEDKITLRVGDWRILNHFTKELNARLRESEEWTEECRETRLAFGYGNHVIVCKNLTGTIYLFWADIKCESRSNVPTSLLQMHPVLFNLNGRGKCKAIYIFKRDIVTHKDDLRVIRVKEGNPKLLWPKYPIFVCEAPPPPKPSHPPIHVISQEEARRRMHEIGTNRGTWVPAQINPFSLESDIHVQQESLDDDDISWSTQTPRVIAGQVVFNENSNMGATPRDPFDDGDYPTPEGSGITFDLEGEEDDVDEKGKEEGNN